MLLSIGGQIDAAEMFVLGFGLDSIQSADACQRLVSPSRIVFFGFKVFASHMGPTADVDGAGGVKRIVTGVAVRVNVPPESGEELFGEHLLAAVAQIEDGVRIR